MPTHKTCQAPAKASTQRTLSPADWLLTKDEVTVAMNGFDRSKYVNRLFDCLRGINRLFSSAGFRSRPVEKRKRRRGER